MESHSLMAMMSQPPIWGPYLVEPDKDEAPEPHVGGFHLHAHLSKVSRKNGLSPHLAIFGISH